MTNKLILFLLMGVIPWGLFGVLGLLIQIIGLGGIIVLLIKYY